MEHFYEIILKLVYLPSWRCCLNVFSIFIISYFSLVPFCSAEQNYFINFGEGSYEEYFCEIILKLGHLPGRRYHLKFFLFLDWGIGGRGGGEGGCIRGTFLWNYFEIGQLALEEMLSKVFLFFSYGSHFVQPSRTILANYV